jgi:LCP family protein required for cell wall assembly
MRKYIKWIALAISALIVLFIGYFGYSFYRFGSNIQDNNEDSIFQRFNEPNTAQAENSPPKWEGKERVNVLLLGGDSRGLKKNEIPRSDTMMLISIDPVTKQAHLFSILRDTYVKIPGHGSDRINAAITYGGPNLAMKTVSELLGIPIQYYVYTDFKGFIALVDAIGGVDIDVEKDMKYYDSEDPEYAINLKKGLQHMDGKTALQYVRFRHDALSDYARTERQRKFMKAVAEKMQSTSSLLKLPSILNSIHPYIETNLTISEMIKLGALGFDVNLSNMTSMQIPPSNLIVPDNIGGASVLTVNAKELQRFVNATLKGETYVAENTGRSGSGGSSSSGTKSSQAAGNSGSSSGTKTGSSTGSAPNKSGGTSTSGTGSGADKQTNNAGNNPSGQTQDRNGTGGASTGKTVPPAGSGNGAGKPEANADNGGNGSGRAGSGPASSQNGGGSTGGASSGDDKTNIGGSGSAGPGGQSGTGSGDEKSGDEKPRAGASGTDENQKSGDGLLPEILNVPPKALDGADGGVKSSSAQGES